MPLDDTEDKFLFFYMEQTWEEMRHLENLREKVTLLVITIATAIFGFLAQQKFSKELKPLVWILILLGVFGFLMVAKIYQLHRRSQDRLDTWYSYLTSAIGSSSQVIYLRNRSDIDHHKKFSPISSIKHNYFWVLIHAFIAITGLVLLLLYPKNSIVESTKVTESPSTSVINNIKEIYHHPTHQDVCLHDSSHKIK